MRGIAESGTGRYKFLATGRDIPKIVSKSIHGLLDIYASEAVLDFRGGEHAIVSHVYNGEDDDDTSAGDAPGLMHLGDLHNANERLALAELEVSPPGNTEEGKEFVAAEVILRGLKNGAPVQLSGIVKLRTTRNRQELGNETTSVQSAFTIRRGADMDREVADLLARGDRQQARDVKQRQLAMMQEALEAVQRENGDTEMLSQIIERAKRVAEQLDDERENLEIVRRQCVQERELCCAMSCASFGDRSNSSVSFGDRDVANLRDFDDDDNISICSRPSSPSSSPRGNHSPLSTTRSRSRSPAALQQSSFDPVGGAGRNNSGIAGTGTRTGQERTLTKLLKRFLPRWRFLRRN
jgi:hypothetical protein